MQHVFFSQNMYSLYGGSIYTNPDGKEVMVTEISNKSYWNDSVDLGEFNDKCKWVRCIDLW